VTASPGVPTLLLDISVTDRQGETLLKFGKIVSVMSENQVETTADKTEASIRGDEISGCLATNAKADKMASVTLLARLRRWW
jgi:hypothetical protein